MGEQLDRGWEPWGEALARARLVNLLSLRWGMGSLFRLLLGSWTGPGRAETRCGWAHEHSVLPQDHKVQQMFYFKAK